MPQTVALGADQGDSVFRRAVGIGSGTKGEGLGGTPGRVHDFTNSVLAVTDLYNNGGQALGAPATSGGGGNACTSVTPNGTAPQETGGGAGGGNGGSGGTGGNCLADTSAGTGQSTTGGAVGREIASFVFNGLNTGTNPRAGVGRAFMGGGGGAGALNSAGFGTVGSGGQGGGIVFASAKSITNTGGIVAEGCNGVAGDTASSTTGGGGGGGGAGGTVVVLTSLSGTTTYSGVVINADGGNGANAGGTGNANRRGLGGGGGGGRMFFSLIENNTIPTTSAGNGTNGLTDGQPLNASSGNQGDIVGQLSAFNSVPGVKPGFSCESGTVPVTLSGTDVQISGNDLQVNFDVASEAGTLGYRILADLGNDLSATRMQVASVDSKNIDSLRETRYTVRVRDQGYSRVWIEEVAINGKATLYGPFAVGTKSGDHNIASNLNWAAVNDEQSAFRSAQARALRGANSGAAEVTVDSSRWVSFSADELSAAGVDLSNPTVKRGASVVPCVIEREGAPQRGSDGF